MGFFPTKGCDESERSHAPMSSSSTPPGRMPSPTASSCLVQRREVLNLSHSSRAQRPAGARTSRSAMALAAPGAACAPPGVRSRAVAPLSPHHRIQNGAGVFHLGAASTPGIGPRSTLSSLSFGQKVRAQAVPSSSPPRVDVDVDLSPTSADGALVVVQTASKPGLLRAIVSALSDAGLDIVRAEVDSSGPLSRDRFWVRRAAGGAPLDEALASKVKSALASAVQGAAEGATSPPLEAALVAPSAPGQGRRPRPRVEHPTLPPLASSSALLHTLMAEYSASDVRSIQQSIAHHVEYTLARSRTRFSELEAYLATAYSVRDRLIESWNDTQTQLRERDPKRVYYLSMEFLLGRSLLNALECLGLKGAYAEALQGMGFVLERVAERERDAALGNGGLGRLAACFLDSMATARLPAWGYGIRYQYGMFRQTLVDGFQHEQPDFWLTFGNPWELERAASCAYPISFYGHVSVHEQGGRQVFRWNPGETLTAVPYDVPIPGHDTHNVLNLRLWAAKPDREFDLQAFNTGDYVQAILSRQRAETLTSVLYPDDRTYEGKELRLKQQHFFVSATVQDVLRRYREAHADWEAFGDKVAFQLNDTHPALLVPELMRQLMDVHGLGWTRAWELVRATCHFTNHGTTAAGLEKWAVDLLERLLPRHMQIVHDINWRALQAARARLGDDWDRIRALSIVEDDPDGHKYVRMAHLAVVASRRVNGVADVHSRLMREDLFRDLCDLAPERFASVTNGVTPRRWLAYCNPALRALLSETVGSEDWVRDLDLLREPLERAADDPDFRARWAAARAPAKARALDFVARAAGVPALDSATLLDVQVKRVCEYKRQLMNVLAVAHRYLAIRGTPPAERAARFHGPRVCVLAGKAAPGYDTAKRVIKLACAVAAAVNADSEVGAFLRMAFVPDYNVSVAEVLIPGADLSQHISTAGTEASGTGVMKCALNGVLVLGSRDGANLELAREIGEDNLFLFGGEAADVAAARRARRDEAAGSDAGERPSSDRLEPRLKEVVDAVRGGALFGWADYFAPLMDAVCASDEYLVGGDFAAYIDALDRADAAFRDKDRWVRASILSTARSGYFSSDRTIKQYATEIWNVEPMDDVNEA